MAFGTLGSTLNDELNRLANGGTYRTMPNMVDDALAAKQWANRENIVPYSTDTVGILNEIAALGPNRQNWYDFNGVCNYLAGTTGLPAAAALRQITTTGDILTSLAAFYTDAATPRYNYPGYIYLNGTAGNCISVPNDSSLQITNDIEIIMRMSMDDWTPVGGAGGSEIPISKRTGGSQDAWSIGVLNSSGFSQILFAIRNSANTAYRAVFINIPGNPSDGSTIWLRITRSASTGVCSVFAQPDSTTIPTSWGTPNTFTDTIDTLFPGTANIQIGQRDSGVDPLKGKVYRAIIRNGIGGTTVLDADLTTNVTSATYDQFTATTGQLCTILGQNTLTNAGTAGSLLPVTVGSSLAADSNDAKFLDFTGTNYVYLPGVGSNYLSVPDAASLDITGDIDIRAQIAADNWTNGAFSNIISKDGNTTNISYSLNMQNNLLRLDWSTDGTTRISKTSTAGVTVANGATLWVRATLDVDNGAAGNDVKFFTSTDGTTWTQLGTTVTTAGVTSIYSGAQSVGIGGFTSNNYYLAGKVFRAQIFSDITGTTKVLDVDTSVITTGSATSFTAVTGQTVTINRSTSGRKTVAVTQPTWLFGTDDYMEVNNRYMDHTTSSENYVYLSGASGNYMSVADNPPLDVTGDIDIQVKVAMDDWTPAATQTLINKATAVSTQFSYQFNLGTTGGLQIFASLDGINLITATSVATGFSDGSTQWVRFTRASSNGDVKFFTSSDGTTWTQLGTTQSTTAGSLYAGTAIVEIGSRYVGAGNNAKGKFYRAIIKNGIDGTTVLDANAATITSPSQTTFTDSSSNAYTVTINKSGVGTFVSTGNYLYAPGVLGNDATSPDTAAVSITGDIDVRVKVALDDWTPASSSALLTKWDPGLSYYFYVSSAGLLRFAWTANNSTVIDKQSTVATGITDGTTKWVRATLDVDNGASGNTVTFFTSDDGANWTQLGAAVTTAGVTSIYDGTAAVRIASAPSGDVSRGKFFRAQVLNGINGTLVFDANFEGSITSLNQASFTESSSNAATVTINRSGSAYRSAGITAAGYLYPGATNTFSNSTIDYLNFGASQDFTIITVNRLWNTPASSGTLLGKRTVDANWGYVIRTNTTTVNPQSYVVSNGTLVSNTVATTVTAGTLQEIGMIVNRSTNTISTIQNGTTATGTSISTVGSTSNVATFQIGALNLGANAPQDFEFIGAAVFRSVLTAAQIRQISNYFANREVYL